MNAVITAGGPISGAYAKLANTKLKGLVQIHGATMLAHTIDAARGAGAKRIAVVGNDEVKRAVGSSVDKMIPDSGTGSGNVLAALDAWGEDAERLLYLTCDMPYVSALALQTFVSKVPANVLSMALCEELEFFQRFPQAPGFGITLNGEVIVNGGAFLIPAGAGPAIGSFATQLFDSRKAPWRMASIAGPALLLKFIFGRLAISEVEERATALLGMPVRATRGCAPELGFDADTVAEYQYALTHD